MKKSVIGIFILMFLIVGFASALDNANCPSGMVSYWEFNDDATDSFGGNDGSLATGTLADSSGKVGKAVYLASATNSFSVSDFDAISPTDNLFSLVFWVQASDLLEFAPMLKILNKQGYSINTTALTVSAQVGDSAVLSGNIGGYNNWSFIVLTSDGTTAKMYINGSEVDSKTYTSIGFGADDLIVGQGFIGLVDEMAVFDKALTQSEIQSLYQKASGSNDYCYVPSGVSSGTTTNFILQGCEVPTTGENIAVDQCSSDGLYFCKGQDIPQYTIEEQYACSLGDQTGIPADRSSCCPAGYECITSEDSSSYVEGVTTLFTCVQRNRLCSNYTSEKECSAESCYWVEGEDICLDPNDPSLSCSIYTDEIPCEEDLNNFGRNGAGTEVCGTYTEDGFVIPSGSCSCEWVGGECDLTYEIRPEISGSNLPLFKCLKSFTTGACLDGFQDINWTAKPVNSETNVALSKPFSDVLSQAINSSKCVSGVEERGCGEPLVKLPGFGFVNFVLAGLLLGLVYFFLERK